MGLVQKVVSAVHIDARLRRLRHAQMMLLLAHRGWLKVYVGPPSRWPYLRLGILARFLSKEMRVNQLGACSEEEFDLFSKRVPLLDQYVNMGTHYDTGVNKGYPSRCCVRNTKHSSINQRI